MCSEHKNRRRRKKKQGKKWSVYGRWSYINTYMFGRDRLGIKLEFRWISQDEEKQKTDVELKYFHFFPTFWKMLRTTNMYKNHEIHFDSLLCSSKRYEEWAMAWIRENSVKLNDIKLYCNIRKQDCWTCFADDEQKKKRKKKKKKKRNERKCLLLGWKCCWHRWHMTKVNVKFE